MNYNDMRVKDLKQILEGLPEDMLVIIPVTNTEDVNYIYGFRKVRTAGICECEREEPSDRKVICLNAAADGCDIADQIYFSDRDVSVTTVLYGYSKYDGSVAGPVM